VIVVGLEGGKKPSILAFFVVVFSWIGATYPKGSLIEGLGLVEESQN
jgi:hypothetical protein